MGRLILCSGKLSEKPYTLKNTSRNIYSMEELCLYLYRNAATAEDFLYDEGLLAFIGTELGLPKRAERLAKLIREGAAFKDIAITLFCSTDLYTRAELEQFAAQLDGLARLQSWQQQKQKADSYMEQGMFGSAGAVLERLIRQAEGGPSEELLGDIYHNLGVCRLHLAGAAQAAEYFAEAYDRNKKEESLFAYLTALRLAKKQAAYVSALEWYQVTEEQKQRAEQRIAEAEAAVGQSEEYRRIRYMRELVAAGKLAEYKKEAKELTDVWKRDYRAEQA